MSFVRGLIGGGKTTSTQQTAAAGLQVQTSVEGKPIPIVYGITRVAPNLIWYGDFTATQQDSSVGGKGGLTGGGGKGGGSGSYVYSTSFQMGLGEGPIKTVWDVYADKNVSDIPDAGMSLFLGAYRQAPWSYLITDSGLEYVEYYTVPHDLQVTTSSPFLYDLGVTVTVPGGALVPKQGVPQVSLEAGQYNYTFLSTVLIYQFSADDDGKQVTINYTYNGEPQTLQYTISGPLPQTNIVLPQTYGFEDVGANFTVGEPLVKVPSSPSPGCYTEDSGTYTFNSGLEGSTVIISYVPNVGQSAAIGYSGIAYVAAANFSLGNNPSLPNFNFEVSGLFSQEVQQTVQGEQYTVPSSGPPQVTVRFAAYFIADAGVTDQSGNVFTLVSNSPGTNQYTVSAGTYTFGGGNAGGIVNIDYDSSLGPDADPSQVVNDLLTNEHYGIGFPSSRVGDLSTYQAYCLATGLVISPCYDTQAQSSSMLEDIATASNSAYVWSSGALTLVPYGDQSITANGYTYTPPAAPEYSLTDDDFLPNQNATGASASFNDDPVLLTRKRNSDAFNAINLEWLDRGNNYSPALAQAKDQAAIQAFGLRQDSTRSMHLFCNGHAARNSVQLLLQRQSVRNIYQFTLDQRYVLLDPMDIVAITDSRLGLAQQWVRILEITENDDSSLSFVAEEYLQGTGTAPRYTYQSAQGFNADYNADPGPANTPVLFEPTAELAENLEVWMAISGGPLWGGSDVWISQDGESYQNVGKITGPSRQGFLTADLPSVMLNGSGLTIDQDNKASVDISLSGGQMLSASQSDAQALATLCYLGSGNSYELMSYQNAAFLSGKAYDLSYLIRGAYDSPILSHAAGEQFARLDNSIFQYAYTQDKIGKTIYVKLVAFNIYAGGQQSIADVTAYPFVLQGVAFSSPLPDITNLRTSYVANITQLSWDEVSDFRSVLYEIRKGSTWAGAQVLGRVAHPPFNVQGNGIYWVSAFSQPVAGLQVYSETPKTLTITGAQIVSNVIEAWDEAATGWKGTLGGSAGLAGGNIVLAGAGDILSDADYLNTPDILHYGGVGSSGTYTLPDAHIVNIGYVAPCSLIIATTSTGQHIGDDVLGIADYLNYQDLLDSSAQALVSVSANIALSQDGLTWGPWFKWTPGSYIGMAFKAQAVLESGDPTVTTVLEDFIFEVDVPDRDDHYTNLAVPSGGIAIDFQPDGASTPAPFNGGPAANDLPAVQVTILDSVQGDTVIVSSLSLAGCTLQVKNGGVGVARNVNVLAQGF